MNSGKEETLWLFCKCIHRDLFFLLPTLALNWLQKKFPPEGVKGSLQECRSWPLLLLREGASL